MRLCIDASNLRLGGGVTHLVEVLGNADAAAHGFERVFVWACGATLRLIPDRPWLTKSTESALEANYLRRALWQRHRLGQLALRDDCDLIFSPGGSFATSFRPIVTMCRNMLPFEWREMARYGMSLQGLRLLMLRFVQLRSFRRASATIFLTKYAYDAVRNIAGTLTGPAHIIPHGVDTRFFDTVRPSSPEHAPDPDRPIELLYVSIIDHYKHQDSLARAATTLAARGYPVRLNLVGPAYPPALRRLRAVLREADPEGGIVRYLGPVPHAEIHALYSRADIGIFASSCENMPNILLEQMAAGLPIACSNRGPMPEILGGAGVYFDPENIDSICTAVQTLVQHGDIRRKVAAEARARARQYSWKKCADDTFALLAGAAAGRRRAGGSR